MQTTLLLTQTTFFETILYIRKNDRLKELLQTHLSVTNTEPEIIDAVFENDLGFVYLTEHLDRLYNSLRDLVLDFETNYHCTRDSFNEQARHILSLEVENQELEEQQQIISYRVKLSVSIIQSQVSFTVESVAFDSSGTNLPHLLCFFRSQSNLIYANNNHQNNNHQNKNNINRLYEFLELIGDQRSAPSRLVRLDPICATNNTNNSSSDGCSNDIEKKVTYSVLSNDFNVHHKTTNRQVYTDAKRRAGEDCFDVLLVNEQACVTECTIANIAFLVSSNNNVNANNGINNGNENENIHGDASYRSTCSSHYWITPCLSDGCLPGVLRAQLIKHNLIKEQSISLEEIHRLITDKVPVICFNSLRGIYKVHLLQ